jgi:biotin carboxylase
MNPGKPTRIVIVDGYSTGRDLLRELVARGAQCLHLQSTPEVPAAAARAFSRSDYHTDLGYRGQPAAAAESVRTLAPDAVVAGSEWGVTFAEQLACRIGTPTNRQQCIHARRNKYDMVETVHRAGLPTPEQAIVDDPESALAWARAHGRWPIVVKPLNSAGSDGVRVCHGPAEVLAACVSGLRRTNLLGRYNDQLLVQAYLDGPQYIVNTVSSQGEHFVTDVWHMATRPVAGASIALEELHLLDPHVLSTRALVGYALDVITALGIENGAAHTELKLTARGPVLIETGARLMGAAMDAEPYLAAGIQTQASCYARLLTEPHLGAHGLRSQRTYACRRHLSKVFFGFAGAGTIAGTQGLARLAALPSFHSHHRPLRPGDTVWRTADTLACGGVVYLVHDDRAQIKRDVQTFRAWEAAGLLYDIEPAAAAA